MSEQDTKTQGNAYVVVESETPFDAQAFIKNIKESADSEHKAKVEFKGITFEIRYISRAALARISQACVTQRWNPKTRTNVPNVDSDKFFSELCRKAIIGWEGVTPRSLSNIMAVDLEKVPEEHLDKPIPFSFDLMVTMMTNAYELDEFIQNLITDISVFQPNLKDEMGNSKSSQSGR